MGNLFGVNTHWLAGQCCCNFHTYLKSLCSHKYAFHTVPPAWLYLGGLLSLGGGGLPYEGFCLPMALYLIAGANYIKMCGEYAVKNYLKGNRNVSVIQVFCQYKVITKCTDGSQDAKLRMFLHDILCYSCEYYIMPSHFKLQSNTGLQLTPSVTFECQHETCTKNQWNCSWHVIRVFLIWT